MAHAGTSLDLRQQQATTGSSRQMGFWLALMIAIAVVAIGLAIVAFNGVTTGSTSAVAADHSYDQVEGLRGGAILPATVDRSYDQVEGLRGGAAAAPADDVYDLIEKAVRGGNAAAAPTVVQPQFEHAPGKGPLE